MLGLTNLSETVYSREMRMDDFHTDKITAFEPTYNQANFNTELPKGQEIAYAQWKAANAPHDSGFDYDLVGAFRAGLTRNPVTGHMPDQFKKPNHPTFSTQSQYATGKWAKYAGTWKGEEYTPAKIYTSKIK